jgi:hypothetical protein
MTAIDYKKLIDKYLDGKISAEQFIIEFNKMFLSDNDIDEYLLKILESVFEDGDAYSPLWTEEDENFHQITEKTLRKSILKNNEKLKMYIQSK